MRENPAISVITAVYNGARYLGECLDSLFKQTFTDFEVIVVDDGSTDSTPRILENWQKRDKRLKILTNPENKGRAFARNRALTKSRGQYLAVLDADDYSIPERLEIQYQLMQEKPEIQVVGGDIKIHGTDKILTHPRLDSDIRADLFFDSSLFHSTVMMRKTILTATRTCYDIALPLAQDYGLWAALMFNTQIQFANIPRPLSTYRLSDKPRHGYAEKQFQYANEVRRRILRHIGINPDLKAMRCHLALLYCDADATGVSPVECATWGKKLTEANRSNPLVSPKVLDIQITERLNKTYARAISKQKARSE